MDSLFEIGDEVQELVPEDFDDKGRLHKSKYKKGVTILMIYAPWCGHCHHTKPELVYLAHLFNPSKVRFTALNGDAHRSFCTHLESCIRGFHVDGFPTLVKFRRGKYQETYQGSRDRASLFQFLSS